MDFGLDTFVLRLVGDAMAPVFRAGELIYVDPDVPAESGRFVAMRHEGTGTTLVRRIVEEDGRQVLRAQDSDVPDCGFGAEMGTSFLGVVVFAGREV